MLKRNNETNQQKSNKIDKNSVLFQDHLDNITFRFDCKIVSSDFVYFLQISFYWNTLN